MTRLSESPQGQNNRVRGWQWWMEETKVQQGKHKLK